MLLNLAHNQGSNPLVITDICNMYKIRLISQILDTDNVNRAKLLQEIRSGGTIVKVFNCETPILCNFRFLADLSISNGYDYKIKLTKDCISQILDKAKKEVNDDKFKLKSKVKEIISKEYDLLHTNVWDILSTDKAVNIQEVTVTLKMKADVYKTTGIKDFIIRDNRSHLYKLSEDGDAVDCLTSSLRKIYMESFNNWEYQSASGKCDTTPPTIGVEVRAEEMSLTATDVINVLLPVLPPSLYKDYAGNSPAEKVLTYCYKNR